MCGRFASARKRQELLEEFGVQRDRVKESLRPDYNVAPTKPVYAVLTRRPKDSPEPADGRGAGDTAPEGSGSEQAARGNGSSDRGPGHADRSHADRGPGAEEPGGPGGVGGVRGVPWG